MFWTDLLQYDFLQRSVAAALLAAIACGVLGAYSIVRRNSYMVGAISHSLLGGIGLARYLCVCAGLSFLAPIHGAIFFAFLSALIITILSNKTNIRTDTVLSAIWTTSIAVGLCFVMAIPGYAEDLNSYLFGNILLISKGDLIMMGALDAIILLAVWAFRTRFLALCFHRESLELRGISVFGTELMLNILCALAIVLLVQIVGIVMALALFILPVETASRLTRKLNMIMLLGGIICLFSIIAGIAISYTPEWHTGSVIIIISIILYFLSFLAPRH